MTERYSNTVRYRNVELADTMRQTAWNVWSSRSYPEAIRLALSARMYVTAQRWRDKAIAA